MNPERSTLSRTGAAAGAGEVSGALPANGVPATSSVSSDRQVGGRGNDVGGPESPGRVALELVSAVFVGGVTSLVLQWIISRTDSPIPSNVPTALVTASTAIIMLALAMLLLARRSQIRTTILSWAALSALTTVALAFPLLATRFYLGGISIDQSFRTQYLTRLTSSPELADMNYAEMPPFYPAGWFWVGGRLAALAGWQGWEFYKPYAITTMAVTAALTFTLWALLVSRRTALAVAAVTAVVGLRIGATGPYAWILVSALPPLAVVAWRALRAGVTAASDEHSGRQHRWALAAVGAYLGLCGAIYTLYFLFAVVLIVVLAAVVAITARLATDAWSGSPLTLVGRLAGIAAVAAPIVLLVWAPFLWAALRSGLPSGAAQRYLPEASALLPVPMAEPSVLGALCLAGTVWLLWGARSDQLAQPLGVVVLLVYGWYALSTLALAFRSTLLSFRFEQLVVLTLAVSGVLAIREVMRRLPEGSLSRRVEVAAAVVGLLFAISAVQAVPALHRGEIEDAYADHYPTGVTATGQSDPDEDGTWYDDVIGTIADLDSRSPSELIVLSTNYELMSLQPYRGFQQSTAHYANPLADFDGRRVEIARWARAADAAELVARLDASPYPPPTVFVLRRQADGLRVTISRDTFPANPNVEFYDEVFAERAFAGDEFVRRDVGPFAVIVRR